MGPDTSDVRALPVPSWLAAHSEPNIEAIVAMLGPEMQQRYRRCLAEEVRSQRPGAISACRNTPRNGRFCRPCAGRAKFLSLSGVRD